MTLDLSSRARLTQRALPLFANVHDTQASKIFETFTLTRGGSGPDGGTGFDAGAGASAPMLRSPR